jgi:RNA polymerase sigma-70 factor (ECF subfamily)
MRPATSAESGDSPWKQRVVALTTESSRAYLIALRIVGSPALAEEVVQEAYAKLLQHPLKNEDATQAAVYLFKTIRSTAIDLSRSAKNRKQREDEYAVKHNTAFSSPDALSEASEVAQAARAALTELPLEEREAISLCCEQDLPRSTVSQILDVPESTVYDRMQRGLEKLRMRLATQGFASVTPILIGQGLRELGVPPAPSGLLRAVGELARNTASNGLRAAGKKMALAKSANAAASTKVVLGVILLGAVVGAVVFASLSKPSKPSAPQNVTATPSPAVPAPPPVAPAAPKPTAVKAVGEVRVVDNHEGGLFWYQVPDTVRTTFELSSEQAHGGKKSLRVAYQLKASDPDPYTQLLHPFSLQRGDRALRFAIFVVSSDATANWNVQFRLEDAVRTCWLIDSGFFRTLKPGWNEIELDLRQAPLKQTYGEPATYTPLLADCLIFSVCNGSATFFLDDFEVINGD